MIEIIECPRDAMQGLHHFVPTHLKVKYLNRLLKVGFDTLDFGSFVSPKAIPQLADTAEVLAGLDLEKTDTKLLAIVANMRGAVDACKHEQIHYLGYPFSISETFQERNTRKSIQASWELVQETHKLCLTHDKELVIYISMAFGNPYNDPWSAELAAFWVKEMANLGIKTIALADTTGSADKESITKLFGELIPLFPDTKIGAHFHSTPAKRLEKIQAAWESGCRRFDVALQGYGGCPFATDDLTGNTSTESLLAFCAAHDIETGLDGRAFAHAGELAAQVFEVE